MNFRDVTRRAIHAERRQIAEMADLPFREPNRPAELRIRDQTEVGEILLRKKIGINFDERAQHRFGYHFRAHRSMQKEIEIVRGPFRDLRGINARRCRRGLIGSCVNSDRDGQDRDCCGAATKEIGLHRLAML